jgi:hypothetical protein
MEQSYLKCRKTNFKTANIAEITKFLLIARKPHFKLRKALFKRGIDRDGKNKNKEKYQAGIIPHFTK